MEETTNAAQEQQQTSQPQTQGLNEQETTKGKAQEGLNADETVNGSLGADKTAGESVCATVHPQPAVVNGTVSAAEPQASGKGAGSEPADAPLVEGRVAEGVDWAAQLAAKEAEMADMKVGYELQLAGARNVVAAKALLAEYQGDIAALKAAEPWMFEAVGAGVEPETPKGATGLSSAGAAVDEGATLKHWRTIAGLEDSE